MKNLDNLYKLKFRNSNGGHISSHATAALLAMLLSINSAYAGPAGEQVVAGDINVQRPDLDSTHIFQDSQQAIINWQSFNIGIDESVRFDQPNADARVLNRVMIHDATTIAGQLSANGQVYIANPAGVLFSGSAVVNVGSLVAAAGQISDSDFLSGIDRFTGLSGSVQNYGMLNAESIALLGLRVDNFGQILAPDGTVIMAAGEEIHLVEGEGLGHMRVELPSNTTGSDEVSSASALGAGDPYSIAAGNHGQISASDVVVTAENVNLTYGSEIDATGTTGGEIHVEAESLYHEGSLIARGLEGEGGSVTLNAGSDYTAIGSALVDVSGESGGYILSTVEGRTMTSGTYNAVGESGEGGQIDFGGPGQIGFLSAKLDASGETGGGTIRVGGPLSGGADGDSDLPVASQTIISQGSILSAEATGENGDGGEIIIWSDQATQFYGEANARPGQEAGNGGFIELSSANNLLFSGQDILNAGRGDRLGEVLIDPKNIIITNAAGLDLIQTITGNTQILREGTLELDNGDEFGEAVAFNEAGTLFIVGAPGDSADGLSANGDGVVYLFGVETDNLSFAPILEKRLGDGTTLDGGGTLGISTGGRFGSAVAINEQGNQLAVGAEGDDGDGAGNATGAVYMLTIDVDNPGSAPTLETVIDDNDVTLADGDKFGSAVAFNRDADIMGVGAEGDSGGDGSVFLFDISTFSAPVIGLSGNPVTSSTGGAVSGGAASFGSSISFNSSGGVMAIGAENSSFSGGSNRGGVYIFTLDPDDLSGTPTYQQRFQYSDLGEPALGSSNNNLRFGSAVSFNADNTILAVGARGQPGSGGATNQEPRVFLLSVSGVSTLPNFEQRIDFNTVPLGGGSPLSLDSEGQFGAGVSISGDGTALLVGAPTQDGTGTDLGEVFLFEIDPNNLSQAPDLAQLLTDGSTIRIPEPLALTGGDGFGNSVALNSLGDVLVIGTPGDDTGAANAGAAYVFSVNPDDLADEPTLVKLLADGTVTGLSLGAGDNFGSGVAVNGPGDIVAVGASGTDGGGTDRGAAYLFEFDTSNLFADPVLQATLNDGNVTGLADNDLFGRSVALDNTGGVLLVGQPGDSGSTGAVDVFSVNTTTFAFTQENTFTGAAVGDEFGTGVAVNEDATILAVGSPGSNTGGNDRGAVSVYSLGALNVDPTLEQTIDSNDVTLDDGDEFGTSVALSDSGSILAVGAPFADGDFGSIDSGEIFFLRLNTLDLTSSANELGKLEENTLLADGSNFTQVDAADQLGSGVALNGGASIFVAGAANSDISGSATGAAHLFTLTLGRDPTQALFTVEPGEDWFINPADIVSVLDGNNLTMQANTDITVESLIDATGNAGNGDLTLEAGRSLLIEDSILLNGSFTASVNHPDAIAANRDAGDAVVTMDDGVVIDTSLANGSITIEYLDGTNNNDATGTMTLDTLNAGTGSITIETQANEGGSTSYEDILLNGPISGGLVSVLGNAIIGAADAVITASDNVLFEAASTGRFGGDIDLEAAVNQTGTGTLTFRPVDSATPIRVGGVNAGEMGVDIPTLDQIAEGFAQIIFGSPTQSGDITIAGGPSGNWLDDLLFLTDSGNIFANTEVNTTGSTNAADILYQSNSGTTTWSANQTTDGGDVTVETPLLVDGTITVDTEAGDDGVAGNVLFVGSDGSRTDNAIDALNGSADTLTVDARGTTDGNVDIQGHVGNNAIAGSGGILGALIVEGAATVDLSDVTTAGTGGILIGNSKATTGPINLHASTLDTSGAGAGTSTGGITLNAAASQDIELLDGDVVLNTDDQGYNSSPNNATSDGAVSISGNQIDGQNDSFGIAIDSGSSALDQGTDGNAGNDIATLNNVAHFVGISEDRVIMTDSNNDAVIIAGIVTGPNGVSEDSDFIYRDSDAVTIGTAEGVTGIIATMDVKVETVDGTLTVDEAVEGTNQDVLLSAGGAGNDLDSNNTVTSGRHTSILAQNDILQGANVSAGGTIDAEAFDGVIAMETGTVSDAGDDNIRYAANGNVTVEVLDAGTGNISVISANGSIVDAQGDTVGVGGEGFATNSGRTVNIIGDGLRLDVANGSVGTAGNPLDTSVSTVAASVGGSLYLYETDSAAVGSVGPLIVNRVDINSTLSDVSDTAMSGITAGTNAKLETINGTLTVDQAVEGTGGDVLLAANGSGSDLELNATVTSGGNTSLLARDSIFQNANVTAGSTIDAEAFDGVITMDNGAISDADDANIRYAADGNMTLEVLNAGTGNVSLVTNTGSVLDAQGDTVGVDGEGFATQTGDARETNVIAAGLRVDAGGDMGAVGNPLDTSVATIAADVGGNFYQYESDGITVGSVGPVTVNRVALNSSTSDVTDTALSGISAVTNAKLETINGSMTVSQAVDATGGDVLLAANGSGSDLDLDATVDSDGSTTLLARDSILQSANVTAGSTIDAEAFDGVITMDSSSASDADNANIRYAADGNVTIEVLDAGTGNVSVVSDNGSILDAQADTVGVGLPDGFATNAGRTVNIIGSGLRLDAANGSVGAAGNPLDTAVGTVAATAGGSVYQYESDALTVGTVGPVSVNRVALNSTTPAKTDAALSGISAGTHAKVETIDGTLTVDQSVTATDEDVLLAANGTGSDVDINADASAGGYLSVLARDSVTQDANFSAGTGTIDVEAFDGDILMGAAAESQSSDNNIRYTAEGDVAVGILNAGTGDVSITANTGRIYDAQGDTVDVDADGFATQTGDPRVVNVIASNLRLNTALSVNDDGATIDPLDTSIDTLAGVAGESVYIYETDDLTIGTVGPVAVNRVALESTRSGVSDLGDLVGITAGTNAKVETINGTLTVDAPVEATSQDVLLAANGDGSDLDINATVDSGRRTTLLARDSIFQSANVTAGDTIDAQAFEGSITMDPLVVSDADDSNIRYTALIDVVLGILNAGTGNIGVIADTGAISDAQSDTVGVDGEGFATQTGDARVENLIGTDLRMDAGTDIGVAGNPIDTAVTTVAAVAGSGSAYIYESDAVNVGTVAPVPVQRVHLNSTTDTVTDAGDLVGITAGTNAKVETINGTLEVDQAVEGTGGDVLLAANGAGSDLDLNATVTSGGNTSLLARNSIFQSENVTAGSTIDAEAFDGVITMDNGAISDANDANIRYAADGNASIEILNAGTGDVSVVSENGNIIDAQSDTVGVDVEGFATNTGRTVNVIADELYLSANGEIGTAADPLDTDVATVAAQAGTNAYIYESNALTIGTVDPVEVNRVALASSTATATDAAPLSGITAGTNAKVETINGTLTVDAAVEATDQDVLLAANGTGSDLDINATVDSGRHTTLLARDSIFQSANVTAGDTIDAQAFDGSIIMDPLVVSDADDSNIRYTALIDVVLGILNAGTGNIGVFADTGAITDAQGDTVGVDGEGFATQTGDARVENLIGTDLRMDAGTDIGVAGNPIDTAVTTVAAVAGSGSAYIYESDAVNVGTVAPVPVQRVHLNSTTSTVTDDAALSGLTAGVNAKLETIDGTITVDQAVEGTGGDVLLAANGDLSDLDLNATVVSGGNTSLLARNSIFQSENVTAGSTIDAEAFDGVITMDNGAISDADDSNIRYAADGNVTIETLNAGTADVSITSDTGSILDAQGDTVGFDAQGFATQTGTTRALNVIANELRVSTAGDVGAVGNPLDTLVDVVAATVDGSYYIYESDALTIDTVGPVDVNRVALASSTTTVTDAAPLPGITAGTNAKVETINGTLTVNAPVEATGQDVLLAANGDGSDLDINATVDSGRHTTLLARDSIFQSANVTAGDTIDAQAFDGSIIMDPLVVSAADDSNIRYTALIDVVLGILNAGTGNIGVFADTGAITDAQGDTVGVDGEGFATQTGDARVENLIGTDLRMDAGTDIGVAGNPIDTAVTTVAAVAGSGSAYIYESDAVNVGTVAPVPVQRVHLNSTTSTVTDDAALSGLTAGVNAKLETIDGTITVDQAVEGTDGDVLLAANGDLSDLDLNATVVSGGNTSLLARNSIFQSENVTAGSTIDAEAFDGVITMDNGSVSDADDSNIRYAADGNVTLEILNAGTANISVISENGSILDAQGDTVGADADGFATQTGTTRVENLISSGLRLEALNGGVGTAGNPLDSAVDIVTAEVLDSVYLYESDDLTIGFVDRLVVERVHLNSTKSDEVDGARSGITAGTHAKVETINGTLTVNSTVEATDENVLLAANGDGSDVNINAQVSSGDHLSVLARDSVFQNANLNSDTDGADDDIGTIDVEAFTGSIIMDGATVALTDNDNIRYTADVDVGLGLLDAGTADVSVIARNGRIYDTQGDTVDFDAEGFATQTGNPRMLNVIASGLRLDAALDASGPGGVVDPIDTSIDTLAGNVGQSVYIYETDDLIIGTVDPVPVERVALESTTSTVTDATAVTGLLAGSNAKVETIDGTLTVDAFVEASDDDVLLAANGAGNDLDLNATVTSGGNTSLLARDSIFQSENVTAGGTIDAEAFDGVITMDNGAISDADDSNIRYAADGNVTIEVLNAGGGDVSVISDNGSIVDAQADTVGVDGEGFATNTGRTVNIIGDDLRLSASSSVGDVADPLDTAVNSMAADVGGSIYIYESNGMSIDRVGPISVRRVHLNSTTSPETDAALSGIVAGNHSKVETIGGTLVVDRSVAATDGDVLLAANGAGSDVNIDANASAAGNLSVIARDTVSQDGNLSVGAGTIDVEAYEGSILMGATASSTTTDNNIRYSAAADVAVGLLDAGTGDVAITADTGRVYDAQGDTVGVDAEGFATQTGDPRTVNVIASGLRLDSNLGVNDAGGGPVDPLDTSIDTLAGNVGESVYIYETDDLTIGTVDAVSVNRVALESTTSTVTDDAPLVGLTAGVNAKVETIDGTITVDQAVEGTDGDVLLAANGAGSDLDLNATVTSGGNTSLLARNSILQSANVTAGSTIDAEAFDGVITMDSGTVSDANDANIRYAASGDISLALLDAGNGDVSVLSSDGSILEVNAGNNIAADYARLEAGASIGAPGDDNALDIAVNTVGSKSGANTYLLEANDITVDDTIDGTDDFIAVNRVALNSTTSTSSSTDNALARGGEAGGVYKLETTDGSITVAESSLAEAIMAVSHILLKANGSSGDIIQQALANIVSTGASALSLDGDSGSISILADQSINQNADITTDGGTLDVEAFDGALTMADGTVTSSNGGNIRNAANSDITLGQLDAGTGDVSVVSQAGNILEATAGNNISADYVRLEAIEGSIGAAGDGNALDIDATTLGSFSQVNTYLLEANSVTVDDTGSAITVNSVQLDSNLSTVTDFALVRSGEAGGVYKLETTEGSITVAESSVAEAILAGGDILLKAGGADSDVTQQALANIESTGGNISILAQDSVNQNANISTAGGTLDVEAFDGEIAMAGGTVTTSNDGDIRYAATGNVSLSQLNAGNGDVSVYTDGGSIAETENDGSANIIANTARLDANGSIGAPGNSVDVDALATALRAGDSAYVNGDNDLIIGTTESVDVARIALNSTTSTVTDDVLTGAEATDGDLDLSAGGNIVLAVDVDSLNPDSDPVPSDSGSAASTLSGGSTIFRSPVVLNENSRVTAGATATFTSTVDSEGGENNDLTLSATNGGDILFEDVVGGVNPLGDVLVETTNDLTATEAFTAQSFTQTASAAFGDDTGDTEFMDTLTTTVGDVDINASAGSIIVADVISGDDIILIPDAGSFLSPNATYLIPSGTITLNGDLIALNGNGDIQLGPLDRGINALGLASIIGHDVDGDLVIDASGTLTIGSDEKFSVIDVDMDELTPNMLTLRTTGGDIFHSDLSVDGNILVEGGGIVTIALRDADDQQDDRDNNGDLVIDDLDTIRGDGTDIVATGFIDYSGVTIATAFTNTLGGSVGQPQFSAPNPKDEISENILDNFTVRILDYFPELVGDLIVGQEGLEGYVLDAISSGPIYLREIGRPSLAESTGNNDPLPPEILSFLQDNPDAGPTQWEKLENILGISVRSRSLTEVESPGVVTFDDIAANGMGSGITVSVGRLNPEAVTEIIAIAGSLFDGSSNLEASGQARSAMALVLEEYMQKNGSFDAGAFRDYLSAKDVHSNADRDMGDLNNFWRAIEALGLNDEELEKVMEYLFSKVETEDKSSVAKWTP